MRRTSQSMYQSKGPVVASKVFDGSQLFKSSTAIPAPQVKKVEGQDLNKSDRYPKKNFEQTVNNLKNKPNQKVLEQEYIGGLQEEIKYLEYQLKLLKDKQLIQREGVNELDNFLKDEIPINENILAMKNKYNSTKAKLEDKQRELSKKIIEADEVLKGQRQEIDHFHKCIDTHRKQVLDRRQEFREKLENLVKQMALTREEYNYLSEDNKHRQEEIKKFNEEIATIQRKNQKEKIQQVRENQNKQKTKEKFEEKFKAVKEDLVETLQKFEQLQAHGETNPLLQPLQQQNSSLRKRIMLNEKQKSTAENIIAEIELFLKQEQREREAERQQKGKLTNQSETYRSEIQYLERYVDTLIKEQTTRYKNKWLKEMNINLIEKQQTYDLLTDRLRNLEQECSNLIQEKKELNDAIEAEKALGKEFDTKIEEQKNSIIGAISNSDSLDRLTQEISAEIPPTRGQLEKCRGRIPIVEREIEKRKVMLQHLNKQIDLLKELKTLDLEQLQMISQGGSNVQHTLHSFIKSWEKIKSL